MNNLIRVTTLASLVLTALLGNRLSLAQSAVFLDNKATHCEIFKALSAQVPSECSIVDKAIIINDDRRPATYHPYAIATRIQFEFNSYRLLPSAKRLLDKLGDVFNDELMLNKTIRIEGHADASGQSEYNRRLSYNRALAVQQYLVHYHRIAVSRLPVYGVGESRPYDRDNPYAAINRRVGVC